MCSKSSSDQQTIFSIKLKRNHFYVDQHVSLSFYLSFLSVLFRYRFLHFIRRLLLYSPAHPDQPFHFISIYFSLSFSSIFITFSFSDRERHAAYPALEKLLKFSRCGLIEKYYISISRATTMNLQDGQTDNDRAVEMTEMSDVNSIIFDFQIYQHQNEIEEFYLGNVITGFFSQIQNAEISKYAFN